MQIDNWHLKCPKCGSDADLMIEIRAFVSVQGLHAEAQGYADPQTSLIDFRRSWSGKSVCECGECEHSATVEDFKED